ncbi:MAG: hypothetical protein ACFFG0_13305 [Candidatus Thorarchaeota archaeon]
MVLQGDLKGPSKIPRITVAPDGLPCLLIPVEGTPLEYNIEEYLGYKYLLY